MQKRIKINDNTKAETFLSATIGKLKTMIDTDVVIGEKIETEDVTIIPLTKLTVGFVSGGGEYSSATGGQAEDFPFSGGAGAGYTASPVGLVVIKQGGQDVSVISINKADPISKLIETLPGLVDKINDKINNIK